MRKQYDIISRWLLAVALLLAVASCSKEDSPDPSPEPVDTVFYRLHRVENFQAVSDDTDPTTPPPAVYFSLESKKVVPDSYAKTSRWDLAFGGLYNSFLSGNNGADPANNGYGANGEGAICILKKKFEDVTDIPEEAAFRTGKDLIGTDDSGAFGQGTGWYLYDFGGKIKGDGSYEKQHVAYALPDIRTIVVRTAKGNYAKIKMISCYKDAFTPDKWFRSTPHMYFTFEYVMVPKGSQKFEIR